MAAKRTGISYDLLFHPGETIGEILIERGISQAELAVSTGVSAAYVSNIISGKKDISANFAMALEYALRIPKSFWLNLQANYDAELLELNETASVTETELCLCDTLKDIIRYLRQHHLLPTKENGPALVLSLRKALQVSNLENLKDLAYTGAFRLSVAGSQTDPYILGAWVRLCQLTEHELPEGSCFSATKIDSLVTSLKKIMCDNHPNFIEELKETLCTYGIDFSVVKNFRGAPVQGYISQKSNNTYRMVLTIRGAYADIFWFSLFHELGHVINGDISKASKFIDAGTDPDKERAADFFASSCLLQPQDYASFIQQKNYSFSAIEQFALSQHVMPYIVIGRLQKEGILNYNTFSDYKLRYKWNNA